VVIKQRPILSPLGLQAVLADLNSIARARGIRSYETPSHIRLLDQDFSEENGLLTPTHKLRRSEARERFERELHSLVEQAGVSR